jgi:hypothetical protein
VEYSLCRLTDPSVASPGSWTWNEVYQNKTGTNRGIKVLNDSTLVIYLKRLFLPWPESCNSILLYCSREAVEKYGAISGRIPSEQVLSG